MKNASKKSNRKFNSIQKDLVDNHFFCFLSCYLWIFSLCAFSSKGQAGRRSKASVVKSEESSKNIQRSALEANDRSLLAEKTFEFKSEDESPSVNSPIRKASSVKIKLSKKTSDDSDSNSTPPTKHSDPCKSTQSEDQFNSIGTTTVFGQTANGSSVSYQRRAPVNNLIDTTPVKSIETNTMNGASSGKKRGRPRLEKPTISSSIEESSVPEFNSVSPSVTTKFTTKRKPIIKPQAFMNSSANDVSSGQHDIRTGFLAPFEEQEVLDALEQLDSTKTFEEAEQKAKRRFEHILCLNLNRTHVDIPQECKVFFS